MNRINQKHFFTCSLTVLIFPTCSLHSFSLIYHTLQSKGELDKRDRLIGKYEKYYRQLKRDAERREAERKGNNGTTEFEKLLSAGSQPSSSATTSSSSSLQANNGSKSNPTNSSSSSSSSSGSNTPLSGSSNNIGSGTGTGTGTAQRQQPRAPSMVQARNKHPSISTLETTLGLQRDRAGASGPRYTHSVGHR